MKDRIVVGVVGAGRALELHAFGYHRSNIPVRLKTVMARRSEQIREAVNRYGFEKVRRIMRISCMIRRLM